MSRNILGAFYNQQYDVLALYFSKGISPDHLTCLGNTPLLLAIRKGDLKMCKFLLEHDSPASGDSKAFLKRVKAFQKELLKDNCLLNGADPDVVAPDGLTAFRIAKDAGHGGVAKFLPPSRKRIMRRIKFRSRKPIHKIKKIGTEIYDYCRFGQVPKFLTLGKTVWKARKGTGEIIGFGPIISNIASAIHSLFDGFITLMRQVTLKDTLGAFEVFKVILNAVFVELPLFVWKDVKGLAKALYQSFVGLILSWWTATLLSHSLIVLSLVLGKWLWKALTAIGTGVSTVTLQDVVYAFKEAFDAVFVQSTLLAWKGMTRMVKALDKLMTDLFDIFWSIAKLMVRIKCG
ncbi:hypothetical protein BT96DRAFT_979358 [Gymnopus androsaceus JB14]|uniref:Uncharacterized protein n=1 Tax=Gymnopus androsaceus JB14 TaxID=1447944 RepID=A0A6A4H483_9AGAR|nr:hypothetical protein BT96DRAFT_979358 [Gymnopus androsaceus JB14]